MTPEQMGKAIEFILNSQAQSEIRQAQAEVRQARNDEQIAKLGERLDQMGEHFARSVSHHDLLLERLAEAQTQTAKDLGMLSKRVDRTSAEVETMSRHLTEFIAEMRAGRKSL